MPLAKQRKISRRIYPKGKPIRASKGLFSSISIFAFTGQSRFSFSVSKKTARSAVLRNKIRREGYRAVSDLISDIKEGFLIRFSVYKIAPSYNQFASDIKNLLEKSGILS